MLNKFLLTTAVLGTAILTALLTWSCLEDTKPHLFARIQILPDAIVVTNINETPWPSAEIYLNSVADGPAAKMSEPWTPREVRTIPITEFSYFSGQALVPGAIHVRSVSIFAPGYQMARYEVMK